MDVTNFTARDLKLIPFFFGFASAIIQVLLIREMLSIFRGNEFLIGIIFCGWFLGIFLGARYSAPADEGVLHLRIRRALLVLPLIFIICVYAAHFTQLLFPRQAGAYYPLSVEFMLTILFTMPVSFMIGYFFPPIVHLASIVYHEKSGGTIYYIESLGSFAGGIAFTLIMVDHLTPIGIIGILFLIAVFCAVRSEKKFYPLAAIAIATVVFSSAIDTGIVRFIWKKNHSGRLVNYVRTKYQSLSIESESNRINVYGDGILAYSIPDRYESRNIFHLMQALRGERKKILLFGSGPGSLLYNLLKTDVHSLTYCEPDPGLWKAMDPYRRVIYGIYPESPKLKIVLQDMIYHLNNTDEKYDMIISLAGKPENIMLNRFFTREYYARCREHLAPGGIFISTLPGFSSYISNDRRAFTASIYKAFTDVYPANTITSGETIYLVGSKDKNAIFASSEILIDNYTRRALLNSATGIEKEVSENFNPVELMVFFERSQIDYFKKIIAPLIPSVSANSSTHPVGYWQYLVFSASMENSSIHRIMKSIIALPLVLMFITILIIIDIKRKNGAGLMVDGILIGIIGIISMSSMVVLIMLYQNFEGLVYHRISLITALYMFGLSLGGYVFTRKRVVGIPALFVMLTAALGLFPVFPLFPWPPLFWVILFVIAFLCGALFPSIFTSSPDQGYLKKASLLDSMEHFGAILGSLLTTMFLLPVLGIPGTIAVNISLALAGFVLAYNRRA